MLQPKVNKILNSREFYTDFILKTTKTLIKQLQEYSPVLVAVIAVSVFTIMFEVYHQP